MLAKEIYSLQHPIVKKSVNLRKSRKFRYSEREVLISGIKQVREAKVLKTLFIHKKSPSSLRAEDTFLVNDAILKKITGLENPEPLAAIVPLPKWSSLQNKNWILVLDQVSDPGNLGTLLRTALGLGWEGVFLTESCVDPFNDKALRAAKGASFLLPLRMGSIIELQEFVKDQNISCWIADMQGKPIHQIKQQKKGILILGNESQGISEELKKIYNTISIPIQRIESLNVAIAGSILMYMLKT